MTDFDRQARVVASAYEVIEDRPEWTEVVKHFNLGLPYAHLHTAKHGTLNKEGKKLVTDTYEFLLTAINIPESDYYSFWDMISAREA